MNFSPVCIWAVWNFSSTIKKYKKKCGIGRGKEISCTSSIKYSLQKVMTFFYGLLSYQLITQFIYEKEWIVPFILLCIETLLAITMKGSVCLSISRFHRKAQHYKIYHVGTPKEEKINYLLSFAIYRNFVICNKKIKSLSVNFTLCEILLNFSWLYYRYSGVGEQVFQSTISWRLISNI